jgi:hypothetical protein
MVVGLLALLLAVGSTFERTLQQKLRVMAEQALGRRLKRQIEIGPLHLGWSGLAIAELRLSEIPTFRAGTFISAKGLRLGWGLRSLVQGLDLKKRFITRSKGDFQIDDFRNPHYLARDFTIRWSLANMDPTWSHLNGWVKLEQGPGLLQNIDQLLTTSPSAKIALIPVLPLLNLEKLGILKLGLPDLRHWPVQGVQGAYTFTNGRMTIEQFTIDSAQLGMAATGVVDLGSGNLSLNVQLHSPTMDAKVRVSGTISHPKVDLDDLKKRAFQATLSNFLQNQGGAKQDVDKVLKNLFR